MKKKRVLSWKKYQMFEPNNTGFDNYICMKLVTEFI